MSLTIEEQKALMQARKTAEQFCAAVLTSRRPFNECLRQLEVSPTLFWSFVKLLPLETLYLLHMREAEGTSKVVQPTPRMVIEYALKSRGSLGDCTSHFNISEFQLKGLAANYAIGGLSQILEFLRVRMIWDLHGSRRQSFVPDKTTSDFADYILMNRPNINELRAWFGGHGSITIYTYLNHLAEDPVCQEKCIRCIANAQLIFARKEQVRLERLRYNEAIDAISLMAHEEEQLRQLFYNDWRKVSSDRALSFVAALVLNCGYRYEELITEVAHNNIASIVKLMEYLHQARDKQLYASVVNVLNNGYLEADIFAALLIANAIMQNKDYSYISVSRRMSADRFKTEGLAILGTVYPRLHDLVLPKTFNMRAGSSASAKRVKCADISALPEVYSEVLDAGWRWADLHKKYGSIESVYREIALVRRVSSKHRADDVLLGINRGYSSKTARRILLVAEDVLVLGNSLLVALNRRHSTLEEVEQVGIPMLKDIMPVWASPLAKVCSQERRDLI